MFARPVVRELVLVAAVAAFAVTTVALTEGGAPALTLAIVGSAALVARHRTPVAVLVVVVVTRLVMAGGDGGEVPLVPAAVVALYTVARTGDRRVRLPLAIAAGGVMALVVPMTENEPFLPELAGEGALMLLPVAVAEAARSRAERLRDLIETEAASRVHAERLRIARDLHDVVAHGLSTIAIQAGVAARLVDRDPDHARDALETINRTGKRSLEELRTMVGVLRSTDAAPYRPAPSGPGELAELVAAARAAGVEVTLDVAGEFPSDAADAAVVAVHRIVQEALTNVVRHAGPVAATVAVVHGPNEVTVEVANASGAARIATASTGVGVVGMTERADALGGTLSAGPRPAGGYEVVATIPYRGRRS